MLGADTEATNLLEKLVPGSATRIVMYSDVQEMNSALIFAVVTPDVCQGAACLKDDGYAVQLRMSRMEDVTCHGDA